MQGSLRIITFNVHAWHNRHGEETFSRISTVLERSGADVIALQEATKSRVPALASALGDLWWVAADSTAILARTRLSSMDPRQTAGRGFRVDARRRVGRVTRSQKVPRHTWAAMHVQTEDGGVGVQIVALHLDHVHEPKRISELAVLIDRTNIDSDRPTVFLGDFNALTRGDYGSNELRRIASVRASQAWEPPKWDLTSALTRYPGGISNKSPLVPPLERLAIGAVDAWVAAMRREGELRTSRFDTRIDYVFLNQAMASAFAVAYCAIGQAMPIASDHNPVLAVLEYRGRCIAPDTSSAVSTGAGTK
mmetsp:Transcript_22735/g.61611  ORF Transcript_22735/g.61611 Transcript_22735/m.61611 type:complete len:307 (+) Transcript_22735:166-1086(+)